MKPTSPRETTITCQCGWSRRALPGENAEEAARYHDIQVHNNVEATTKGRF